MFPFAAVELSVDEGILAARSRCNVLVTARPTRRVSYRWKISYMQNTASGMSLQYRTVQCVTLTFTERNRLSLSLSGNNPLSAN